MPVSPLVYSKIFVALGLVALSVIRMPHEKRNKKVAIAESRRSTLETWLLAICGLGMVFVPLAWLFTPIFTFADHPTPWPVLYLGTLIEAFGVWIFYRSHADLGTNWSISLEVRKSHTLVTQGVYKRIRHPMYTSAFVFAFGCALLIPNWIVGWVPFLSFAVLYIFRVSKEERMMLDRFGAEYSAYKKRTKRIIPGLL